MFILPRLIKCSQRANADCYPRKACNQWLLPIASIASIYRKYNMRLPAHSPAGPILRQGPSPFLRQICCCCISMVPPSKPLHVDGDMEGVTIAVPEPTAKEAQLFEDALQRQEQQNESSTPQ